MVEAAAGGQNGGGGGVLDVWVALRGTVTGGVLRA